jgi:hypothetical protein
VAAPILPFAISSLPPARFLGEAERYLEYAAPSAAVLFALQVARRPLSESWPYLLAAILAAGAVYAYSVARRKLSGQSEPAAELDRLVGFLSTLPPGSRIVTIPLVNLALQVAYRLEHRFVSALDPFVWARDYDELFHRYPWTSTRLRELVLKHRAEYLAVSRYYLSPASGCSWTYDIGHARPLFESQAFAVYAVPAAWRSDLASAS